MSAIPPAIRKRPARRILFIVFIKLLLTNVLNRFGQQAKASDYPGMAECLIRCAPHRRLGPSVVTHRPKVGLLRRGLRSHRLLTAGSRLTWRIWTSFTGLRRALAADSAGKGCGEERGGANRGVLHSIHIVLLTLSS